MRYEITLDTDHLIRPSRINLEAHLPQGEGQIMMTKDSHLQASVFAKGSQTEIPRAMLQSSGNVPTARDDRGGGRLM